MSAVVSRVPEMLLKCQLTCNAAKIPHESLHGIQMRKC